MEMTEGAAFQVLSERVLSLPQPQLDELLDYMGRAYWALIHSVCGEAHCEYRRPLRCNEPGLRGVQRTPEEAAANDRSFAAADRAAQMINASAASTANA